MELHQVMAVITITVYDEGRKHYEKFECEKTMFLSSMRYVVLDGHGGSTCAFMLLSVATPWSTVAVNADTSVTMSRIHMLPMIVKYLFIVMLVFSLGLFHM